MHEPERTDVVIIGAGPYGLSLAAHLQPKKVAFRIFGHAMETWRSGMPRGMRLKSEGFASSLSDPAGAMPLSAFCRERKIPYRDVGLPVELQTFSTYGLAFQKAHVPQLEERTVTELAREETGFRVRLDDGTTVLARRVVMAVGIGHYQWLPPALEGLPSEAVTHSARVHDLEQFRDRDVVVVGAGASAIDVAGLLYEAGARPQIVTRRAHIPFQNPPEQKRRSLRKRLRQPRSGLGTGWKSWLCCEAPLLLHRMPAKFRLKVVRTHLGPAPGWFMRDTVVNHVPAHLNATVTAAAAHGGKVCLEVLEGGERRELAADHVIAATGYRVNLDKIPFLGEELRGALRCVEGCPELSSSFESSVTGLYFVGASAANSFGPLLRFACGAEFASRHVSRHLARHVAGHPSRQLARPLARP